MTFTVTWKPKAERQLTEIWLDADDRNAVTEASHQIDTQLRKTPETAGESRDRGRRILIESPLAVIYRVHLADRRVDVIACWWF